VSERSNGRRPAASTLEVPSDNQAALGRNLTYALLKSQAGCCPSCDALRRIVDLMAADVSESTAGLVASVRSNNRATDRAAARR
jgi:hypothetical protein